MAVAVAGIRVTRTSVPSSQAVSRCTSRRICGAATSAAP